MILTLKIERVDSKRVDELLAALARRNGEYLDLDRQVSWLEKRCDELRRLEAEASGFAADGVRRAVDEERAHRRKHAVGAAWMGEREMRSGSHA